MSTLYPTELGPLDPGARWTVTETKHEDCERCLDLAAKVGALFNEPANAEHWSNGAAEADFSQEDRRMPVHHYALVQRERAQPWTPPTWATTPITEGTTP